VFEGRKRGRKGKGRYLVELLEGENEGAAILREVVPVITLNIIY